MANNTRDVKLRLGVETTGEDEIDNLAQSIQRLAKEGGDAAPEFQALVEKVDQLAQQAAAVRVLENLSREVDQLAQQQVAAKTAVEGLVAQLNDLSAATQSAASKQRSAKSALDEAVGSYTKLKDELSILRATYDENGKRADNYKSEIKRLTEAKIEQRKAVDEARAAYQQAASELSKAEQAEAKLQKQVNASAAALEKVDAALRERGNGFVAAQQELEKYGIASQTVAGAQVELVQKLNRVGAEAEALAKKGREAATYIKVWGDALDQIGRQAAEAEAKSRAAAQGISAAFESVGAKSAAELRAEIQRVRDSMDVLRTQAGLTGGELQAAMNAGNARIKELQRELRGATNQLTAADQAAELFKNSLGQIAAGNLIADAIGAIVERVKEMGRQFVAAIAQLDTFRRALDAIYKDSDITARQLDFLRKTAESAGVSVGGISDSFIKFSASMKGANIPLNESNALFEAVTRAAGTLGLGAQRTSLALDALSQIASKGTVSMEELRQQLGDSLPGALTLTAKGLNLTDAELVKLVESGNLAARDFIPAFTKALGDLRGETVGLVPTWERFKNLLVLSAQNAGDAGWITILTGALKILGGTISAVVLGLNTLFESLMSAGRAAIVFFEALRGNGSQAMQWFQEETEKSIARLTQQAQAFNNMLNPAQQASAAIVGVGNAARTAALGSDDLTRSQKAQAVAAALAGDASLGVAEKYVRLSTDIQSLLADQEKETESLNKIAKARKEEGDTLIQLAKLRGDEQGVLIATRIAAEEFAKAQAAANASQQEEVRLLEQQLQAKVQSLEARNLNQEAIDKETEALRQKLQAQKAEAEQSAAAAAASNQAVAAAKIAVQVYQDNSTKVKEYTDRVAELKLRLKELEEQQVRGRPADEQLIETRKKLAEATRLQKDAQEDYIKNLRLEYQEKSLSLQVNQSAKNSEAELYAAKAESAKRSGDLSMATYYETEAKRAKIEADKLAIEIKKVELELDRIVLQEKLKSLDTNDAMYQQQKREIELKLRVNDLKSAEINAAQELLRIKESELSTRNNVSNTLVRETAQRNANAGSISTEIAALERLNEQREREISAQEKAIQLSEREDALRRKRLNIDKEGFSLNTNGQRVEQFIANRRSVFEQAKSAGLDDATALRIAEQFIGEIGNKQGLNGTQPGIPWEVAVQEAINNAVLEIARKNNQNQNQNQGQGGAGGSSGSVSGRTITINLNGTRREVNVASDADAAALESILRDLESAARRTA